MRTLVTGGTGYLGRTFSNILDQDPEIVNGGITYLVRKTSNPEAIKRLKSKRNAKTEECSLLDIGGLEDVLKRGNYDVIFHLAAQVKGPNVYENNTSGTRNLCYALSDRQEGPRLIFVSTLATRCLEEDGAICSDTPYNPKTDYSKSKQECEKIIKEYAKVGILPTIICPPAIVGPYDAEMESTYRLIKATGKLGFALTLGDGKNRISLIHADDLSRALIAAAHSDETIDKTYVLFDPTLENYTMQDYVRDIARVLHGKEIKVVGTPKKLLRLAAQVAGKNVMLTPKKIDELTSCFACDPAEIEGFREDISWTWRPREKIPNGIEACAKSFGLIK